MKRPLHTLQVENAVQPGFQIAPMIDVVFVIMLFFMVMAASVRKEGELGLQLPRERHLWESGPLADVEITLGIQADHNITMNEEVFDSPGQQQLPQLTRTLRRLAASSHAAGSKVLATIHAEPQVDYQRIIDVLAALHVAGIGHVTFQVNSE